MADDGARIGFEIEFTGLETHEAAELVQRALGGDLAYEGRHGATLRTETAGAFRFELDTRYAKPADDPQLIDQVLDAADAREQAADLLASVVPVEMITDPLPRDQIGALEQAVAALRNAGGEGTRSHPISAFGMHLNAELSPLEAGPALRIAAMYAFVEKWLRRELEIDIARRITPFVDPYPRGYLNYLLEVFAGGFAPPLSGFIAAYGQWNPTRNRGLDLWPILGALDIDAAERALGAPVKNPRPAFHYRLPDSKLADPDWSPRQDVALWDAIARAAADGRRFGRARDACGAYLAWRMSRADYESENASLLER